MNTNVPPPPVTTSPRAILTPQEDQALQALLDLAVQAAPNGQKLQTAQTGLLLLGKIRSAVVAGPVAATSVGSPLTPEMQAKLDVARAAKKEKTDGK